MESGMTPRQVAAKEKLHQDLARMRVARTEELVGFALAAALLAALGDNSALGRTVKLVKDDWHNFNDLLLCWISRTE